MRIALSLVLLGCTATIPSGRYVCSTTADCPPEMTCVSRLCVRASIDAAVPDAARPDDAMIDSGPTDNRDGGGDARVCNVVTIQASADTVLVPSMCDGANYAGGDAFMSLSTGLMDAGLVRFTIEGATRAALRGGRVVSATLTITTSKTCGGLGCPTPSGGRVCARVSRADWAEGSTAFDPYGGADWCRRTMGAGALSWDGCFVGVGMGCGAAEGNAGTDTVGCELWDPSLSTLDIELEPATLTEDAAIFETAAPSEVGFRLEPLLGITMIAGTREGGAPAVLALTICD